MSNDTLRFGISALDLSYQDISEPDELMVKGKSGRMYYKRPDGRIVTYENKDYTQESLLSVMKQSNELIKSSISHYMAYNTIDIAGKLDLVSENTQEMILGKTFKTINDENGFWFRIHGNSELDTMVDYMIGKYNSNHENDTLEEIELNVKIEYGGIIKEKILTCRYDELCFIRAIEDEVSNKGFLITITGIKFPKIRQAYLELTPSEIEAFKVMNDNNIILEPNTIDLVYYLTKIDESIIYDKDSDMKLKFVIAMRDLATQTSYEEDSSGLGMVFSDTAPDHSCIWVKEYPST